MCGIYPRLFRGTRLEWHLFIAPHCVLAQEMLTALLMQPVADLGMTEAGKDGPQAMCDITVADVLGPLLKEAGTSAKAADCSDRARDANFSLLSYSFSLVGPSINSNSAPLIGSAAKQGCSRVRAAHGAGARR